MERDQMPPVNLVISKYRFGYSSDQDVNPGDEHPGWSTDIHLERHFDIPNEGQLKCQVYTWCFRSMPQDPGTCQVRHVGDQDASPSDDLSLLWSQKSRSLDRASRSQDPDDTRAINDECAAPTCSTWRLRIQTPSHYEKVRVFRADEIAEDPDTNRD
ncbi:unnamed protein product [Phytophthora fragariaefolia]|uniref:Unnamed protein product n=1 Tax=Phytophthora fragariaefolia TaxID=1490495 RepID=A0A9W6UAA8_9STRA|nr:unnamed protein product [Phytophthora fragariaefolia]